MGSYGVPISEMTRVCWVRVEVGDGGPVCHVVGTHRRRVATCPVPLAVATALMARGVPSVVRHRPLHRRQLAET
ncbi:MAG: hypothetical protein AB1673_12135 [Actinomycetota bacterium]